MEHKLKRPGLDNSIIIVRFNPWLVGNEESLLREFFSVILPTGDGKLREFFKQYGSLAVFASKTIVNAFVPVVGTALGEGLEMAQKALSDSEESLSQLKDKVEKEIKLSGKHVLIIIDDVDRLDKNEVHSVMRLVRQVADFPNFIYMIGMDVDMVSKSLGDYFGEGNKNDGRSFIDKIVQVPITLPIVSDLDMESIVNYDMHEVLAGYAEADEINEIVKKVKSLFITRRDLIRYCNQLSFVLPNLKDEVNVVDLCLLEAIKLVSNEAYDEIYRNRASLLKEVQGFDYYPNLIDRNEAYERRRKETIEVILNRINLEKKRLLSPILDYLFLGSSYSRQSQTQKKIVSSLYFNKYFIQAVPSNVIPDSELNTFSAIVSGLSDEELIDWLNKYSDKFSLEEVGRASIYLIEKNGSAPCRRLLASRLAKAWSFSNLASDYSSHINPYGFDIAIFVILQIVRQFLLEQDGEYAGLRISDKDLLDETLCVIFTRADLNYCLSMLASCDSVFGTGEYDGKRPILALRDRFLVESFEEQYSRGRFLLIRLYECWNKVDEKSYLEYINGLIDSSDDTYILVLDKFIDNTDLNLFERFVVLFEAVIPALVKRIDNSDDEIHKKFSVKYFLANYEKILGEDD